MDNSGVKKSGVLLLNILLFTFIQIGLTGCDGNVSEHEYLDRANKHLEKNQRNAAIIELKNALQKSAKNNEARVLLADVYLEQGYFSAAEKELRRAEELGVPQKDLMISLAKAIIGMGRSKDAIADIRVNENYPPKTKAQLHYLLGKAQLNMANLDAATNEFRGAIKASKDSPYAMLSQALIEYANTNYKESEEWIAKAEQQGLVGDVEIDVVRGDLAMTQGDFIKAEKYLAAIVKRQPYNIPVKVVYALSFINQDKYQQANEVIDFLLRELPELPVANYMKAVVAYKQKDYSGAKTYSENALSRAPAYLSSRLIAGAANYGVHNYEQANEHLKTFISAQPNHIPARKLLAATQLKLGFSGEAAKTLGDVEIENINDSKLIEAIGLASIKSGNVDAAKEYLSKASDLLPESAPTKARLGFLNISSGDTQKGIEDLAEAIRLDPQLQEAELALALTYIRLGNYEKALQITSNVQNKHPASSHGYTLEGVIKSLQGEVDKAIGLFKKALQVVPGDVLASSYMAAVHVKKNEFDKARQYLLTALNSNKGNLQTLIQLAQLEYQASNDSKAVDYLNRAIESNPAAAQPRIMLGRYYLRKREPINALEAASKVLDRIEDANILEIVGRAQLQLGRGGDAVVSFKKLVQMVSGSPQSHWNLARAYTKTGDFSAAEASLNAALAINPEHKPSLYQKVKILAASKQVDKAKLVLDKLLKEESDNTYVQELVAIIAFIEKDFEKSIKYYEKALVKRSNNILTIRLATALHHSGNKEESFSVLSKWLNKYPEDLLTRKTYADALLNEKNYIRAKNEYLRVVEKDKGNISVLNNLAWVTMQLNELDEALGYIGQARVRVQDNPIINDTLASILIKKKDYKQALMLLRTASGKAPANLDIQFHLAQALSGVGKKSEAVNILKKITDSKNNYSEHDNALKLLKEMD